MQRLNKHDLLQYQGNLYVFPIYTKPNFKIGQLTLIECLGPGGWIYTCELRPCMDVNQGKYIFDLCWVDDSYWNVDWEECFLLDGEDKKQLLEFMGKEMGNA